LTIYSAYVLVYFARWASMPARSNRCNMKQVSRKQTREAINAIKTKGIGSAIGIGKIEGITAKQRKFAEKIVIDGLNASDAYRAAYDTNAKANTINVNASKLMHSTKVITTIQALERAKAESASHSLESLKALVVATLVDVATNSDRDAVRVAAVKTLGTVVGVDMFRETKRIETVKDSDDIKAQIMAQLKTMMLSSDDATTVDATDLLAELVRDDSAGRVNTSDSVDDAILASGEGTPPPPPEAEFEPHLNTLHTIPLKQSQDITDSPIPSEHPPSSLQIDNEEGDIISDDDAFIALYGKLPPCSDRGE